MNHQPDILIIGQGFAGLGAAIICANHGYQVTVIGRPARAKGALQLAQNSASALGGLSVPKLGADILSLAAGLILSACHGWKLAPACASWYILKRAIMLLSADSI